MIPRYRHPMRYALLALVVLALSGCAGDDDTTSVEDEPTTTEATTPTEPDTTATTTAATTAEATTVPTTTTIEPECRPNEVRFPSTGREHCQDGRWQSFPIPTVEPPPSTDAPPSTQRQTTTTTDPGLQADIQALFLLGGIERGEAVEVIDGIIDIIEPFPLDRVDVVTADLAASNIVIVATSGYATEEHQIERAVETLAALADLWGVEALAGTGSVKVGLDLTVDGRRYVVPNESMIAVMNRRMTPQAALGL